MADTGKQAFARFAKRFYIFYTFRGLRFETKRNETKRNELYRFRFTSFRETKRSETGLAIRASETKRNRNNGIGRYKKRPFRFTFQNSVLMFTLPAGDDDSRLIRKSTLYH